MTDELYIKMVLALPESFFQDWKYQEGDTILVNDEIWNIGDCEIQGDKIGTEVCCIDSEFEELEGELIPLPSQKQLQAMMNISAVEFIEDFYKYTEESIEPDAVFLDDMNCFTLAYVMNRKYQKYWNGEAWI